jgi:hypothetical protein
MSNTKTWLKLGAPVLLVACSGPNETKVDQHLELTDATPVFEQGKLSFPSSLAFAESPTTQLDANVFHGYTFDGATGGVVTIAMTGATCGSPDTVVNLFGPEDSTGNRGVDLIHNDDSGDPNAPCALDSKIQSFTLPVDGEYLIVATSFLQEGGGHYALTLTCENDACEQAGAITFASSRIAQTDIDSGAFTPSELFDIGDFLFEHMYQIPEGLGNALNGAPAGTNPQPNFRSVHFAGFGAPEAQSCITCHNQGGDDGAGTIDRNIFQIGDGVNPASGVPRNPPVVLGNGFRQQIGIEMTKELQAEVAAAKASAASSGTSVTAQLSSKNVSFGSIIAHADGTLDTTSLQGVDPDFVVKPFGWKGRESLLRRFVEGGFRVHFGMQSSPSVNKNCALATPDTTTFGTGACPDPDGDGVVDEITEGQLTAMAVYQGLRQTPVRVPVNDPTLQASVTNGEALFTSVGCATCHVPTMRLNSPIHVEPADSTGGAGITFNLATDAKDPHPASNNDGSITVELWSDFKRHDVGAALADSKPFKQIAANQFITPPLWGIATSAPYLHDGRAATLDDAIRQHAGDAQAVHDAYVALNATQQADIQAFLNTLGRAEDIAPPPVTVDLSGFTLQQTSSFINFKLPKGTRVQHGGYLIVARNTSQAQFEQFYGKTLGSNVTFINSGSHFPQINGSETFSVLDGSGSLLDGPTAAEPSRGQKNFQRISVVLPASSPSSWRITSGITSANPGAGQQSTGANQIYIAEFSDAGGTGNYLFEFVELFVE